MWCDGVMEGEWCDGVMEGLRARSGAGGAVRLRRASAGASHVQRLCDMWGINASFSLPLLPELAQVARGRDVFVRASARQSRAPCCVKAFCCKILSSDHGDPQAAFRPLCLSPSLLPPSELDRLL